MVGIGLKTTVAWTRTILIFFANQNENGRPNFEPQPPDFTNVTT